MEQTEISQIRKFNREYTKRLGLLHKKVFNSEISWAEARILLEISYLSQPTLIQVAHNLDLDKSYVSRVIKKLGSLTYIAKNESDQDKRTKLLQLTPIGNTVVADLNHASDQQVHQMLAGLSQTEKKKVYQAITTLNQFLVKGVH